MRRQRRHRCVSWLCWLVEMKDGELTLENMCVTGLVILILRSPATQRRKPKTPVTTLPHRNTSAFHDEVLLSSASFESSPWKSINGARRRAEPRFCQ